MKALRASFLQLCRQISRDRMLTLIILSPILTGAALKFGVPLAEGGSAENFGKAIFTPYLLAFDIFLSMLTPYMFCFAAALIILEEIDTGLTTYLSVSPLGKSGYLISRLAFPAALSSMFSALLLSIFSLSNLPLLQNILLSICSACIGMIAALLIVSFSSNKVEGMALAKLSGLMLIGIPLPFFFTGAEQYFGGILPSFWLAKLMLEKSPGSFAATAASLMLWGLVLYGQFKKKIM